MYTPEQYGMSARLKSKKSREAFYLNKLSYIFHFNLRMTCILLNYGMSANSNPHWTTTIIFVFYLFWGASLLETGLVHQY